MKEEIDWDQLKKLCEPHLIAIGNDVLAGIRDAQKQIDFKIYKDKEINAVYVKQFLLEELLKKLQQCV